MLINQWWMSNTRELIWLYVADTASSNISFKKKKINNSNVIAVRGFVSFKQIFSSVSLLRSVVHPLSQPFR